MTTGVITANAITEVAVSFSNAVVAADNAGITVAAAAVILKRRDTKLTQITTGKGLGRIVLFNPF